MHCLIIFPSMGEVISVGDQLRPLVDCRAFEAMNLDTSFRTNYGCILKNCEAKYVFVVLLTLEKKNCSNLAVGLLVSYIH